MTKKPNARAQVLGSLGGKARAERLSDTEIADISSMGGRARVAKMTATELRRFAKLGVAARERNRRRAKKR